ncbi:hypothetical protein NA57DRAFT_79966 [Rhizodiscina lignyota]|uniref:GH16 domain-containing protein n=1 Tax=Rhizodiscina lignyota TaxID=1504668 RepID=A0A9P4M2P8_9PEZI|nr:hypothetical protein NA57DRAFT_79966 [Rhizodiscina lignyota]
MRLLFAISASFFLVSFCNASVLKPRATTAVIPPNSFSSSTLFSEYWNYNYPWGDSHNGAAIMDSSHVTLNTGSNSVTLTSVYTTGLGTVTSGGSTIQLHYKSGTIYAKPTFTVAAGGGYDISASFIAPTIKGTWPAFWLTAVSGWPPEIDIAEWKGDGLISFNTFNTSTVVKADDVAYPNPSSTHTVKAEVRAESDGSTVKVNFYLDGVLQTTQFGADYIGKAMYLIVDFQMEGSSGSPGPTGNTTYTISDVSAISYNP